MSWIIHQGDALAVLRTMPDEHVQAVVTSPPYWGLRDYGTPGQMGLEATPQEYVERMVEVFREVRRVLRKDGTLWLNMGDSYFTNPPGNPGSCEGISSAASEVGFRDNRPGLRRSGLKPKDLVGMPWRLAFALQADGWWLRSDIVWAKPNPMPESVTDRPTKAHEYVFLLTKSARYYYDAEAIRETAIGSEHANDFVRPERLKHQNGSDKPYESNGARNARTVWTIATSPFPEAHFATFPPELARRCIAAGTSERGGCPECGKPWERVVEDSPEYADFKRAEADRKGGGMRSSELETFGLTGGTSNKSVSAERVTLGWKPGCAHQAEPVPCRVLDPFAGAGTTLLVADRMMRDAEGIELNPKYVEMARRRIVADAPLLAPGAPTNSSSYAAPLIWGTEHEDAR